MKRLLILAALGAIAPLSPRPALSQSAAAVTNPVDGRAVVAEARRVLAAKYVLVEMRPKIDEALAAGLAAGRYDVTDPAVLAERLNADLAAVAHDKHLSVSFDPASAAELSAAPAGAGADDAPPTENEMRAARRRNHGIVQMRVLPGNIRYVESNGFVWTGPESAEAYAAAMRFLSSGDAAIIDLRGNGGGSPQAVQYMISHFMEPGRPLMTFFMGTEGVDRTATLEKLSAPRMVGKPLYVLTSSMSASAAEEFVGHVAGYKLGELVGETTAGAGFRNEFFPLPQGFVISVSVGRAVLASTGKDWEGEGLAPTKAVPAGKALEAAQAHALRRLAAAAPAQEKRRMEATAALLDAQVTPVATALPLEKYAGRFGERTISVSGSTLLWQRQGGPTTRLYAIAPNEFLFENDPMGRVTFDISGQTVTGFRLIRADGSELRAARSG